MLFRSLLFVSQSRYGGEKMKNNNIDPSIFALLITTIAGLILKLRIKIDKNSQTGMYQFLLDFQKQIKEDPELIDNVQKVLEESKQKTNEQIKK